MFGLDTKPLPSFSSLVPSLPSGRTPHKSLKYSKLSSTQHTGRQAKTHKSHNHIHTPEPACEILRLIEEEECDLLTPGCGDGCYKSVCVCWYVCLMHGIEWLYVHSLLALYSQKCLLSFFSPIHFRWIGHWRLPPFFSPFVPIAHVHTFNIAFN